MPKHTLPHARQCIAPVRKSPIHGLTVTEHHFSLDTPDPEEQSMIALFVAENGRAHGFDPRLHDERGSEDENLGDEAFIHLMVQGRRG